MGLKQAKWWFTRAYKGFNNNNWWLNGLPAAKMWLWCDLTIKSIREIQCGATTDRIAANMWVWHGLTWVDMVVIKWLQVMDVGLVGLVKAIELQIFWMLVYHGLPVVAPTADRSINSITYKSKRCWNCLNHQRPTLGASHCRFWEPSMESMVRRGSICWLCCEPQLWLLSSGVFVCDPFVIPQTPLAWAIIMLDDKTPLDDVVGLSYVILL